VSVRGPIEPAVRARHDPRRGRSLGASLAVAVLVVAGTAGLAACGVAGGTSSLGPTTTVAPVQAHLAIDPAEGPIGTLFTLNADGMVPGAAVQFEITFPGEGRAYPGNALVVGDDGTASTTYRATSANQPGVYAVRLTGPQGQLAAGEFRVTDGKPLISTVPTRSGSSTTGKPGTAKPSTTKPGAPTSAPATTAKATTTTARPVPTIPPTTTPPTTTPPTAPPTTA
jgi:hypothetical protein